MPFDRSGSEYSEVAKQCSLISRLPVVVCATHLKAGVNEEMEEVRAEQAEMLVPALIASCRFSIFAK